MLAAVEVSHLLMPAALTLLYYIPIACKAYILEGKIRNHQYIGHKPLWNCYKKYYVFVSGNWSIQRKTSAGRFQQTTIAYFYPSTYIDYRDWFDTFTFDLIDIV